MIFYKKPVLGPSGLKANRGNEPLSVSFPSGSIGLGIPVPAASEAGAGNDVAGQSNVIIASGPEESMMDIRERRILIATYLTFCVVNIVVTCLLYFDATKVDLTKLNSPVDATGLPGVFDKLSGNRSFIERINFGFLIFILIYGAVSVVYENPLGISIYALSISLNFFLGLSAAPYFLYTTRYFLDTVMVYLALVLRSKLVLSFLPFHVRELHRN
jgi:hypothetical protein